LRLHLHSNSALALGVEVNPIAYSCTPCFKIKKKLVVALGDYILTGTLIIKGCQTWEYRKGKTLYAVWIEHSPSQVL